MGVGSPDMTSIVKKSIKMAKRKGKDISAKSLKDISPDLYNKIKNIENDIESQTGNKEAEDRMKEIEDRLNSR